jgi:hypothetical protein
VGVWGGLDGLFFPPMCGRVSIGGGGGGAGLLHPTPSATITNDNLAS